ncbi:MAG: hypothetical protein CW346_14505 [Bacillaceae bacterium]|nr:hypothetical protein [Bacillaceae bacterium]
MDLRQIDCLVHEHVMQECRHRHVREHTERTDSGYHIYPRCVDCMVNVVEAVVPKYSSDMDAAMKVWEALRADGVYLDIETYADFFGVTARNEWGVELACEEHPSLPRAITEVALLVKGVEVPKS